jgi:hypothetical protein
MCFSSMKSSHGGDAVSLHAKVDGAVVGTDRCLDGVAGLEASSVSPRSASHQGLPPYRRHELSQQQSCPIHAWRERALRPPA